MINDDLSKKNHHIFGKSIKFWATLTTVLSTFTGQENTPVTAVFQFSVDQGKLAVVMDQLNSKLSLTIAAPFTLQLTLKSVHVKELNCFHYQPVHFPSFPIFISCFFRFVTLAPPPPPSSFFFNVVPSSAHFHVAGPDKWIRGPWQVIAVVQHVQEYVISIKFLLCFSLPAAHSYQVYLDTKTVMCLVVGTHTRTYTHTHTHTHIKVKCRFSEQWKVKYFSYVFVLGIWIIVCVVFYSYFWFSLFTRVQSFRMFSSSLLKTDLYLHFSVQIAVFIYILTKNIAAFMCKTNPCTFRNRFEASIAGRSTLSFQNHVGSYKTKEASDIWRGFMSVVEHRQGRLQKVFPLTEMEAVLLAEESESRR